jgi:hypothetical protein
MSDPLRVLPNLPESGNGVPDLLDEARWELEWLLSSQAPEGGVHGTTCQSRYGRYGTNLPEKFSNAGGGSTGRTTSNAASNVRRPARATVASLSAASSTNAPCRTQPWPVYPRTPCANGRAKPESEAGAPWRRQAIWKELRIRADEVRQDGLRHPFQWAGRTFWGSIRAGFQRTAGFSSPFCLMDPVRAASDCEQLMANVHHALGRNYQRFVYVSGLPGVTRGRMHGFHHWLAALDARPFLFPGLVAAGPSASQEALDISFPQARPIPIWGYWGDPAMPRDASTPFEGRYTDNDSWSTNELGVDWQGVALYSFKLAQWWAAGAPERRLRVVPLLR